MKCQKKITLPKPLFSPYRATKGFTFQAPQNIVKSKVLYLPIVYSKDVSNLTCRKVKFFLRSKYIVTAQQQPQNQNNHNCSWVETE